MAKTPNPVAFNPDTMTVSHLKACADTLRNLFSNLDGSAEDVKASLESSRDFMLKKFGDQN